MINYDESYIKPGIDSIDLVAFDTVANAVCTENAPAFPFEVSINDCKITLNSDGSYDGDSESFILEAEKLTNECNHVIPSIWCIINALKQC